MSVEQADVVDFVASNPKTNEANLVMVEVRDWNAEPQAIQQLETKFANYANFILSGNFARQFPQFVDHPICIHLHHFGPVNAAATKVLREWAGKLSGVPVSVCTFRLSFSPLVNFMRRVGQIFTDPKRRGVRWSPESGSNLVLVSQKQFVEEFCTAYRAAYPNRRIESVQDLHLEVIDEMGCESKVFLGNAYTSYKFAPEDKAEIFEKFIRGLSESSQTTRPIDTSRVVPILKDKSWLNEVSALKVRGTKQPLEYVHEEYNEELLIVYAEDNAHTIRYFTSSDLPLLGVDSNSLRALACQNLARILPAPRVEERDGIHRVMAGGDYDASILLWEEFWKAERFKIKGDIVVAIPSRDYLLVTGSQDGAALKKMTQIAQAVASEAPYRLTPKLFIYRKGRFTLFVGS